MMITSFTCPCCGTTNVNDVRVYDGAMGYEAYVCKLCGVYSDHEKTMPADDWSRSLVGLSPEKALEAGKMMTITLADSHSVHAVYRAKDQEHDLILKDASHKHLSKDQSNVLLQGIFKQYMTADSEDYEFSDHQHLEETIWYAITVGKVTENTFEAAADDPFEIEMAFKFD